MNFDKVINNMQELQLKVEDYKKKNNKIEDLINSLKKELIKLENKIEKEENEIDKTILMLKFLITKDIINKFDFK